MKVTFRRDVDCDYYDSRMKESYPKYYRKWDNLVVEAVEVQGGMCNIALFDGNTIMNVPRAAVNVEK